MNERVPKYSVTRLSKGRVRVGYQFENKITFPFFKVYSKNLDMWSVQIQMVMSKMITNFVMKYKNPNQFVTVRQKMKKYVFI